MIGLSEVDTSLDDIFNYAYAHAKNKNEIALRNLNIQLDAWFGSKRLLTTLAQEGYDEAVDFLINIFNLNIDHAAEGYARAGNVARVEYFRAQGANPFYIINGYAYGKHTNQVNELLESVKGQTHDIIDGYAQGGHIEQVNQLLDETNRLDAVFGYATSGNKAELKKLLTTEEAYRNALKGAAWSGNKLLVEYLIGLYNTEVPVENRQVIKAKLDILRGDVAGGHIEKINNVFSHHLELFSSLGFHGHKKQVLSLTKPLQTMQALHGALNIGAIDIVNSLIKQQKNPDKFVETFCEKYSIDFLEKTAYTSPFILFRTNRLVSLIDNDVLREYVLESIARHLHPHHALKTAHEIKKMTHEVDTLRRHINEYKLTSMEAQIARLPYVKVWLLQGVQLIKNEKISPVLFLHVTTFVTGFSLQALKAFMSKAYTGLPGQLNRDLTHHGKDKNRKIVFDDLIRFFNSEDQKNSSKKGKGDNKENKKDLVNKERNIAGREVRDTHEPCQISCNLF